jgi:hypothetical protein
MDRLFPTAPEQVLLREAAWETYLVNSPYDNVFEVVKGEYHRAVSQLGGLKPQTGGRHFLDPAERLAQHLMLLYWRGRISWENEGAILKELFDRAPDEVRAEALEFVGHSLWRGEFELPEDQAARLRNLWSRRWKAIRAEPHDRKEAATFGWWFASSGKLQDEWLLEQLLEVLEAGIAPDADHLVLGKLAELSPSKPYETIHAARLLVVANPQAHFLLVSNEPLRRIVSVAQASGVEKAHQEARDLLNELGARGYRALDDLAVVL